jgi:hypothetical protein
VTARHSNPGDESGFSEYKREAPEKSRAVHIEKTTAYEKKILRGIRFKVFGSDYHIKKRQNSPEKSGYLVNGVFC